MVISNDKRVMFDGKTDRDEILELVYEKIRHCGGLYNAFLISEKGKPYSGCGILYSGPDKDLREELDLPKSNEARAQEQAREKTPPARSYNLKR